MRVVSVELAERRYPILIGRGLLRRLGRECRKLGLARRCAIITDHQVGPHYAKIARECLSKSGFDPVLITVSGRSPSRRR